MSGEVRKRSFGWLRQVMSDGELKPTEALTAWAVHQHVNSNACAWAGAARLGETIARHEKVVERGLRALTSRGWLVVERRPGRATALVWLAVDHTPLGDVTIKPSSGEQIAPSKRTSIAPDEGTDCSPDDESEEPVTGEQIAPPNAATGEQIAPPYEGTDCSPEEGDEGTICSGRGNDSFLPPITPYKEDLPIDLPKSVARAPEHAHAHVRERACVREASPAALEANETSERDETRASETRPPGRVIPTLPGGRPDLIAIGDLARKYVAAEYEGERLPTVGLGKRNPFADLTGDTWPTLARWLVAKGEHERRTPGQVLERVMHGFWRHERAKREGFPVTFLLANPQQFFVAGQWSDDARGAA